LNRPASESYLQSTLNIAGNARPHATKHPFYYAPYCGEPVLVFLVQETGSPQ
jgi:hypothetical protein